MPTCQSCEEKWSWLDSMKKILKCRKRMNCHHCGKVQYQSKSSMNKMSLFSLLPLFILPFNVTFNLSLVSTLLLGVPLLILAFSMNPFLLKLSNKDEPLW